ncbi:hypothetical protein AJ88_20805 [Mesorhizobium amorphae CCBAU 01583]|nr:hypothetical protein AJ88_20805 [Mesorhizobium amorphae CCBAU 01583]
MVNGAGRAFEFARDDVFRDVAGDIDRVGAQTADNAIGHAESRRLNEEFVVAFKSVNLDHFDRGVANIEAGTEDALFGDGEIVGELRPQYNQLVKAGAAVDRDRRVDVVLHFVLAAAGADIGRTRNRKAKSDDRLGDAELVQHDDVVGVVVRRRVGVGEIDHAIAIGVERNRRQVVLIDRAVTVPVLVGDRRNGERADDEQVVVVVALEPQLGLVRIDTEFVVAGAALCDHRRTDAGAQPAACRGHHVGEHVLVEQGAAEERRDAVFRIAGALGAENLADVEGVVAGPALQRNDRRGVI